MDILFSVFLALAILIALVNEFYAHKLKVVPMPTLPWVTRDIIAALKQYKIKEGAVIYELGSGWGGLAYHIAKAFPKTHVFGFELSPFPFLSSCLFRRRANLKFKRQDILHLDFSGVDILVFYLMPAVIEALKPQMESHLKTGALVVASGFEVPGWQAEHVMEMSKGLEKTIYIYKRS